MSSPQLDRVFWQDEGWNALSQRLASTSLQSVVDVPASQLPTVKRTASVAGIDGSPVNSSRSAASSASRRDSHRRRKRTRMSSNEESAANIDASRAMSQRINELARRLSSQSATMSSASPLEDRTNVRRLQNHPRPTKALPAPSTLR